MGWISFTRGSCRPKYWTHISCTGSWILYHWATGSSHSAGLPKSYSSDRDFLTLLLDPHSSFSDTSVFFTHALCPPELTTWQSPSGQLNSLYCDYMGILGGASGKQPTCQCRRCGFDPWVGTIPWRRKYNPFQCSCLENPMDRRACWAAVHGVTKSRTRLKQLSTYTVWLLTTLQMDTLLFFPLFKILIIIIIFIIGV